MGVVARLVRWALAFTALHINRQGSLQADADGLSRQSWTQDHSIQEDDEPDLALSGRHIMGEGVLGTPSGIVAVEDEGYVGICKAGNQKGYARR